MVKFSKYMSSHLVPEWRDAYCSYKKLKKLVKRVKNQRSSDSQSLRPCYTLQRRTLHSDYDFIRVTHKQQALYRGSASSLDLVETELLIAPSHASNEVLFFAKLDQELNKVNEFYKIKEMEFNKHSEILDMQVQTLFELKVAEETKSDGFMSSRWMSDVDPELLRPVNGNRPIMNRQKSIDVMDSVVSRHNERLYQTISNPHQLTPHSVPVDGHMQNIDEASNTDMDDPLEGMDELEKQSNPDFILNADSEYAENAILRRDDTIRSRKSHRLVVSALPQIRPEQSVVETSKQTRNMLKDVADTPSLQTKIRHSETMLRDAFIEFYRGLSLLKSYSNLNHIAFKKILKKFDKVTDKGAANIYMRTVEESYFWKSDRVGELSKYVESMFADFFLNGNRHKARSILKPREAKAPHKTTFFLGVFTGCSAALIVAYAAVLHVLSRSLDPQEQAERMEKYMRSVFPIFSMTALLLVHMYMYGWNLYAWRRTRINYAFIFEFAPGIDLDYRTVLLVTTGLTVVFGVGILGHLAATINDSPLTDFIPLGVVLILVMVLLFPFNYFFRSSRMFFLRSLFRLATAPAFKVILVDFFLGDQMCSQVPLLRGIEYAACYYIGGWFMIADGDKCTKDQNFIMGSYVISVLPYWWRLMQCIRRFADEKEAVHIANAFKYLSAMAAVVARTFYGRGGGKTWLLAYIAISAFATVYQAYWDIVMDWGLLNRRSHNKWLRDKLILENKNNIYFISMVLNVLLRLPWVLSVTHFNFGGLDPHLTDFVFAVMEIVRRGHWNFYRLENEHLNNVGKYRAVKTVPLPFIKTDSF